MFVKIVPPPPPSAIKCNAAKKTHTNVYKSVSKHFIVTTEIKEKNNSVFVDRNIIWYDAKKNTYKKKREVQCYECKDFLEENDDFETYDEEFDFYNKCIGNAMNNIVK